MNYSFNSQHDYHENFNPEKTDQTFLRFGRIEDLVKECTDQEKNLKKILGNDGYEIFDYDYESYVFDKLDIYPKEVKIAIYGVIQDTIKYIYAKSKKEMISILDKVLLDIDKYIKNFNLRYYINDKILSGKKITNDGFYDEFRIFWNEYYLGENNISDYRKIEEYKVLSHKIEECNKNVINTIKDLIG